MASADLMRRIAVALFPSRLFAFPKFAALTRHDRGGTGFWPAIAGSLTGGGSGKGGRFGAGTIFSAGTDGLVKLVEPAPSGETACSSCVCSALGTIS